MGTPFLHKMGWKMVIFNRFYWIPIKVFNINWISQHILLEPAKKSESELFRSNVVKKKVKKLALLGFFYILLREYLLKQNVVIVKPPEWIFIAIIARNPKFKGS